jgi:hypothetical protein
MRTTISARTNLRAIAPHVEEFVVDARKERPR